MASINFLYRSTKNLSPLNLRLLYRLDNTDFVFGVKTKLIVSKEYWSKQHNLKRIKDIDIANKQSEINTELNKITNHLLEAFNKTNPIFVNKDWLHVQIEDYYNTKNSINLIPNQLIPYFDKFIEFKSTEITESSIKKYKVIKNLLIKYQATLRKQLLVKDVDTFFKKNFEDFCIENEYSHNTIAKALRSIKTVCNHASYNGIETSYQLGNIKPKFKKVDNIYLSFDELREIENITDEKFNESLENARDWLVISCYTGQRVSDFMLFTKDKIRIENDKYLLEFSQKKTGKLMTIPLHRKVQEILKKRGGDFPRAISDQKYNDYIKKVCELAKINKIVAGSKKQETKPGSKIYRKATKEFKKHELVSSHIGRRSFATNFYGEIPTTYLIYVTGHSTERMFLNYIGKSNKDLALELTKYF